MQFSSRLIKGRLIKRYKRFLADVELSDGTVVTAHCPNTGAMTGCAQPGFAVWLSQSTNPKRKLAYTWELAVNEQGHWIGINTQNANKLVKEALQQGKIASLSGYQQIDAEVRIGEENSRIDFKLSDANKITAYVEVKSVTLLQQQQGYFPDAKTARGTRHLRELTRIASTGARAILLFCVQHTGISRVSVASQIDPDYAEALQHAISQGVEVKCYSCTMDQQKLDINQPLPFNL